MYAKRFIFLLRNVFFILIFLVITTAGYFSISGPQNVGIVDKIVKAFIEKNVAQVKVKNIKTGVFWNWKDASLILSLKNFEITYTQKTFITLPHFELRLSPINLILWKSGQIIKGVTFDGQKTQITYKEAETTKNVKIEKIPTSGFIAIANRYKRYLTNTKYKSHEFLLNIHNLGKEYNIILKDFEVEFDNFKNGFNANIKTEINVDNLKLHSKFTVRDNLQKSLDIKGIISSASSLQNKEENFKIADTDFKMDFQLDISTRIHFVNSFEQVNFQFLQMGTGYAYNSTYLNNNLQIDNLEFKGTCSNNFKQVTLPEIKVKVEDKIFINGTIKYTSESFMSNFEVVNLSAKQVLDKWSDNLYPRVRHWLLKHLSAGGVTNLQITKNGNSIKSPLNKTIILKNVNLKYLKTAPNLYLKEAELKFSSKFLSINSNDAKISNSKVKHITAKIDDLNKDGITMKFNANIEGSVADHIKIANAHYKIPELPYIEGSAKTVLNFVVPFYKTPTFKDVNLDIQSQLSGVGIQNFLKGYTLSNGNFEASLSDHNLHAKGQGKINNYIDTQINSVFSIRDKGDFTIHLNSTSPLRHFQKANIPYSEFFSNTVKVDGTVKKSKNHIMSEFSVDLYNTSVNLEAIGISKKHKVPGKIFIKFDKDSMDKTKISKFIFTIPNRTFNGEGVINNKTGELVHFKSDVLRQNVKGLTLQYDKTKNLRKITLDGKDADISNFSIQKLFGLLNREDIHEKSSFLLSSEIGVVKLRNNISFQNFNTQISNNLEKKKFSLYGSLNDNETFRVYYNYPVLSIVSSNAGTLFRGLGITEKVNAGSLEIKGQFQAPQEFEGNLELSNFYVLKTPSLVNLLTLSAPLSALQSSIKNKGMKFHNFKCPVKYANNRLVFTDCLAESKLLALKISGNIDLNTGYLYSNGIIIPQNVLNTLFKKVPFLNILSGYKNEGLILSTLFNMKGYIGQDIKIQANYLSTLTPGFLREIFKKGHYSLSH